MSLRIRGASHREDIFEQPHDRVVLFPLHVPLRFLGALPLALQVLLALPLQLGLEVVLTLKELVIKLIRVLVFVRVLVPVVLDGLLLRLFVATLLKQVALVDGRAHADVAILSLGRGLSTAALLVLQLLRQDVVLLLLKVHVHISGAVFLENEVVLACGDEVAQA